MNNNTVEHNGKTLQICSRCIYDENVRGIAFDGDGVCNYCHTMDSFTEEYKTGTPEGEKKLFAILDKIKADGKGKKYDCIVGFSGGTDSSYLLAKLVEWSVRPLAVHYDNGWNGDIAEKNMRKVLQKLNVDLYTYKVDNDEIDDIFMSFLKATVPELDACSDLALPEVLYRACEMHGVKYMMDGHSFQTEGIAPMSSMYFDGGYIKDIHNKFGKMPIKTYPLMDFSSFMKWTLVKRIYRIRPLWYVRYSKEEAREYLVKEFDWEYYGGHHLENIMTAINHTLWFPKFGIDMRNVPLAAAVRGGAMSRDDAIDEYFNHDIEVNPEFLECFKTRLKLSDKDLQSLLSKPNKSYRDYKTYKKRFEKLRPLFYILSKVNLVPTSFYAKYTRKDDQ